MKNPISLRLIATQLISRTKVVHVPCVCVCVCKYMYMILSACVEAKGVQKHIANNLVLQDMEMGSHAWISNFTAEHSEGNSPAGSAEALLFA